MFENVQKMLGFLKVDGDITFVFIACGLIFIRLITAIVVTPFMGVRPVPSNVKTGVTGALTVFVYFVIAPTLRASDFPQSSVLIFALILKEALFGFMMGILSMLVFQGIQAAGSMIDNQRSVANARVFNPALGAQTSVFGSYLFQLSIAVFLSMGGHRYFLSGLIQSFQTVPLLSFPKIQAGFTPLLEFFIRVTADTLFIALQLTAPVLIAIFVADLVLGVTNRIAPMINVFELGFNIKGMVGVLLVYLALPLMIYQIKHWFMILFQSLKTLPLLFQ